LFNVVCIVSWAVLTSINFQKRYDARTFFPAYQSSLQAGPDFSAGKKAYGFRDVIRREKDKNNLNNTSRRTSTRASSAGERR
jgi:hypothetical protein